MVDYANEDDVIIVRKELEEALKWHDWYYEFSDDIGVWRRGQGNYERILNLMSRYAKMMGSEAADKIWNANCPEKFKKGK